MKGKKKSLVDFNKQEGMYSKRSLQNKLEMLQQIAETSENGEYSEISSDGSARASKVFNDFDIDNFYTPSISDAVEWANGLTSGLQRISTIEVFKIGVEALRGQKDNQSAVTQEFLRWADTIVDGAEINFLGEGGKWKVLGGLATLIGQSIATDNLDSFEGILANSSPDDGLIWHAVHILNAQESAEGDMIGPLAISRDEIKRLDTVFNYFFRMGFLFRDSWWLENHGKAAIETYVRKEKSSARSAESNRNKRIARINSLLMHMEKLVAKSPDFRRVDPDVIGKLALDDAMAADPKLWQQGQGQLSEYLTYLASEPEYKERYDALFYG